MRDMRYRREIKRGEIYYADLSPTVGSEQGGIRPVLIIQNDVGNKHSPTVIVAAITGKMEKSRLPIHIELPSYESGLTRDSLVLLEQIRTLDKARLKSKIGSLSYKYMVDIDNALYISFGMFQRLTYSHDEQLQDQSQPRAVQFRR